MALSLADDEEVSELYTKAKEIESEGDHIKALGLLEDSILVNIEDQAACIFRVGEGEIFLNLAQRETDRDVGFIYALASVECFWKDERFAQLCALGLFRLAEHLGSVLYYKKCLHKAKLALSFTAPVPLVEVENERKTLESFIKRAESEIGGCKTSYVEYCKPDVSESEKRPEPDKEGVKELRSYWVGLDIRIKRDFMKVSIAELKRFVKGTYNRAGQDTLEEVLASAKKDKKWTFWICRALCSKKFSSAQECKKHLEQHHDADFKPSSERVRVQRIGKDWAQKISVGGWKPVDVEAAVDMIENRIEYVKAFASKSKNGWSEEWPLAVDDEERSKSLQEIKILLVSFCGLKILPCSIRDWLVCFSLSHLIEIRQVSEQSIQELRLQETPQSICFLECRELNQIIEFLKSIKGERKDGTDLVCREVDSFLSRTCVREKIDFDSQFSLLLLDTKRLKSRNAPFVDDVAINEFDPSVHYAKVSAQGDDFISWLVDYSSVDKIFPRPIREHNLDIWLAVLKAVQFTCRTLETKYAKKVQVLDYDEALTEIHNLCMVECGRRRNLQGDQWNSYASLLCDKCEETVVFRKTNGNTISTKLFLCAVQDVLEGASDPTFDFPDSQNCLNRMCKRKSVSDDFVLESIRHLRLLIFHKGLLIDSKILLIDNSRISLLNSLTRLSVFDNRTYMLRLLKPFMLSEINMMESKAKSEAVAAELLLEEEKKSQSEEKMSQSKKMSLAKTNKKKRNKRMSTTISSPLEKTVEHKPSVNLEPEGTSPSLKTEEPEDTLASERGRLEISSNTDNQEEATKVDPDMQLEHLESALGKAVDMTLKALLNIKAVKVDLKLMELPAYDDLEEQVTCALQKVFTAFKSNLLEGAYSVLLSELTASLKEVISMSGNAAMVFVTILQFWPPWKDRDIKSLASLFMVEENERMHCKKFRRDPYYSEQRSYGIVIAADSIRDLKFAFGNMKFENILKLIRKENKMLCDIKEGGCGETNFVHHVINTVPPIFTVVLEWEKNESGKEISETAKVLEWEIDISRIYEGLVPNINYRLVSMVCCGEENEHICLAYRNNRWWVSLIYGSLEEEDVGDWNSVVRFCEVSKFRPEILFYDAVWGLWIT